jgi:hypothetical protein
LLLSRNPPELSQPAIRFDDEKAELGGLFLEETDLLDTAQIHVQAAVKQLVGIG